MKSATLNKLLKRTLFVLILILGSIFTTSSAEAVISVCEMSMNPNTTQRDASTVYTFSVSDMSYSDPGIQWIRINTPSNDFTITNVQASGWNISFSDHEATLTSGTPVFPPNIVVYATSGSNDAESANWSVQMSPAESGDNPKSCGGNLGTSIAGSSSTTPTPTPTFTPIPDTTAPTISEVVVSGVSEKSVTISWQTNENANTRLNYGTSTSYGSSKSDSNMTTSHSITLSDLSTNTTYHGQIQSADSAGNTATSNDFTFATSQTVTTVTVTTTVTTVVTATPTPTPLPDQVKPKVTLSTNVSNIFTRVPSIEGSATDNVGVAKVEYSIDDGKNWAKADQITTVGEPKVSFSFTPLTQGDGNYSLKVRAIDAENNIAETPSAVFIIDRLPPLMGGGLFSLGSQVLDPNPDGSFFTVAGLSPKLTVSAVGGASSIDLRVKDQTYPMSQNLQSRLWSAYFVVNDPGIYSLDLEASDSAKNQTTKKLPELTVLPNGVVSNFEGIVDKAQVRVHYFDTPSQSFRLWSAEQYGQENPSYTDNQGRYKLMLPPGTYYIDITSSHTRPLKTNIFTLTRTTPIVQDFLLEKKSGVQIGRYLLSFPDFGQNDVMMNADSFLVPEDNKNAMVGKEFPEFNLDTMTQNSLKGSPYVVSVMSTWLPQTAAQVKVIEDAEQTNQMKGLVVMSQESSASVDVFAKRGAYSIPVIADPDGELIQALDLKSLPTHYFLDRRGVITKVITGLMSKEEIENNLTD